MPPRKSPRPPPPQSPSDLDADFRRRARKIASALRADADGRVCGDCAHAMLGEGGAGVCMALVNIHGASLTIVSRQATACAVSYLRAGS